jgi:hypothetical protein
MTSGHRWAFKTRFRASAYSWHGSALASKRLEEAVREINSVAKSDRVSAADGCVSLMERAPQDRTHISLVGTAFLRGQSRGEASEQAGWRAAAATPVPGRSSVLRVGERAELS